MLHLALPNQPINQFQLVWQSRHQMLRAYCPNIYNVGLGEVYWKGASAHIKAATAL